MSAFTATERNLIKEFNDYDQTVDVVSCWHRLSETIFPSDSFHRFPKFQPGDLTPDFAITIERGGELEVVAGGGSFICDIKKFPNPFTNAEDEEGDFRAFVKSIDQLKKYAANLVVGDGNGRSVHYRDHDIVLLTKSELVDVVYRFLVDSSIQRPFNIGRPLVLVEYAYDAADQQERYVFRWKQGEHNSPFSHPTLYQQMVKRAQPMKVAPHIFIPNKLTHVLCNDSPPTIYMLVFLWLEVFPEMLSPEQFSALQPDSARNVFHLRCSPASILDHLRAKYRIPVRTAVIRDCMRQLVAMKKAYRVPGAEEQYEIAYSSLSARPKAAEGQESVEKRNEGREYAVIFARMLAKLEDVRPVRMPRHRPSPSGQYEMFK